MIDQPQIMHEQLHGRYPSPPCAPRQSGSPFIALALVLVIFVVLAYIYALIKPQWCDEIWAIIPAANLAFNGYLGMGDQTTLILPTINQETHMYWYPPLSYVSMAGWFKVWGYNLMTARWHTIVWGVVLLLGVFRLAVGKVEWKPRSLGWSCRLRGSFFFTGRWVGVWAALICALDYNFLSSCDARQDIMCAALGIWAITTRSAWLAAAAGLVHPFGIMYPIALTCIKRKIEWFPYLVAASAWGIYILQDPVLWWQTGVNQYIVHVIQIADSPGAVHTFPLILSKYEETPAKQNHQGGDNPSHK